MCCLGVSYRIDGLQLNVRFDIESLWARMGSSLYDVEGYGYGCEVQTQP
jgi:hypothetical protein